MELRYCSEDYFVLSFFHHANKFTVLSSQLYLCHSRPTYLYGLAFNVQIYSEQTWA